MPCFTPLQAFRWDLPNPPFVAYSFSPRRPAAGASRNGYQRIACGQCIGCLLRRSRDWAVRCTHQSMMVPRDSCHFVTLTYSDENLPRHPVTGMPTFEADAVSAFMKRLRTNTGISGVKFFACREYGERTLRPHYHVCLFGLPLDDYRYYKRSRDGFTLFNSDVISKSWQYRGHAVVAPSTFNTVSYTARYTTKKIGSALKPIDRHYATDLLTGECFEHLPERTYSSNRSGIGLSFFDKHHENLFALGATIIGNKRYPLPAYYLRKAKERCLFGYDYYVEQRDRYYRDAEYFDDASLLRQMHDKMIIVDRMVRSVV